MPNSLIVRACVKVVHSGDWSTAAWNNRLRLQPEFLSSKWSILPFSIDRVLQRFFFGTCDILLNVLLLHSDLRWTLPHLPLSKLNERIRVPFVMRFRRFDVVNGCDAFSWHSLKMSVDDFTGASGFISVGVWSSMPFALIRILVENDDEAVVFTIC